MSFIDKPDLKQGFWLGLGVLLAFLFIGLVRFSIAAVAHRRSGNG